jgi:hypothetical protein
MHMLADQKASKPSSKPRSRPRSGSRGRSSVNAREEPEPSMHLKVHALVAENADLPRGVIKLRKKLDHVAEIAKY